MNARSVIEVIERGIETAKNELLGNHISDTAQFKEKVGFIKGLQACIEVIITKDRGDND